MHGVVRALCCARFFLKSCNAAGIAKLLTYGSSVVACLSRLEIVARTHHLDMLNPGGQGNPSPLSFFPRS